MRKTSIMGHFRPKMPTLENFWPKWPTSENYQKSAWNIFLALTSPTCKVSEKSNKQFPRKSVTHACTHVYTTPKVSNIWEKGVDGNFSKSGDTLLSCTLWIDLSH